MSGELNSFEINRLERERQERDRRLNRGIEQARDNPEEILTYCTFAIATLTGDDTGSPVKCQLVILLPSGKQVRVNLQPRVRNALERELTDAREAESAADDGGGAVLLD